jgi:hypothetical protein
MLTRTDLRHLAEEFLDDADGDVQRATELMVEKLEDDERLFRQLMQPLLQEACYRVVSEIFRARRAAIWQQPQPSPAEHQSRVRVLANATVTLFDLPLWGGGPLLRDATKTELLEGAHLWMRQGSNMVAKAKFFRLVARALPNDTITVGDSVTLTKLNNFRRKVRFNHE